jgi:hypothetical protein
MRRRFWSPALLLAAAASTGLLSVATPARAAVVDLVCLAGAQVNVSPPLTGTTVTGRPTGDGDVMDCSSPDGAYPDLGSGAATVTAAMAASGGGLCDLLLTITGTGEITWNDGQVSTFSLAANTNPAVGHRALGAVVTSGPLTGDSVRGIPLEIHVNPDCRERGLTTITADLAAVMVTAG